MWLAIARIAVCKMKSLDEADWQNNLQMSCTDIALRRSRRPYLHASTIPVAQHESAQRLQWLQRLPGWPQVLLCRDAPAVPSRGLQQMVDSVASTAFTQASPARGELRRCSLLRPKGDRRNRRAIASDAVVMEYRPHIRFRIPLDAFSI
jgi:hypothetical protein